jgi:hypothetical protein
LFNSLLKKLAVYIAADVARELNPVRQDVRRELLAEQLRRGTITAKVFGSEIGRIVVEERKNLGAKQ